MNRKCIETLLNKKKAEHKYSESKTGNIDLYLTDEIEKETVSTEQSDAKLLGNIFRNFYFALVFQNANFEIFASFFDFAK